MIPTRLNDLMRQIGIPEHHSLEEVFHSQGFEETLYLVKTGYAKRYQITADGTRVLELIYGPDHVFPISQLYKKLYGVEQNEGNLVYIYQAMTDLEIYSIKAPELIAEIEADPTLYNDLFYEAGIRIKSNIHRLASNALRDDYKKIAHQLVSLVDEFGEINAIESNDNSKICVPLKPVDMAEQLNISTEVAEAVMGSLKHRDFISIDQDIITITDMNALKDIYL